MVSTRDTYDKAKKLSDEAWKLHEVEKAKLMEMMKLAEREEYIAPGIGKAVLEVKLSYQTPKTLQDKNLFFDWLEKTSGTEVMQTYRTVNAVSMNSLLKQLTEEAASKGEVLMPEGLGEPVAYEDIKVKR